MFISKLVIIASLFSNFLSLKNNNQLKLNLGDRTAEVENLAKGIRKSKIIDNNNGIFKEVNSKELGKNQRVSLYTIDVHQLKEITQLPKELYVKGDYFKYNRGSSNSSFEFSVTDVKLESNSFAVNVAAEVGSEYVKAMVELGVKIENSSYESISSFYRFDFKTALGYYPDGYYSADLYVFYNKNKLLIEKKVTKSRQVTKTESYTHRYVSSYNNKGQPIYSTETRYRTYTVTEYYEVWEKSKEFIYYTPCKENGSVVKMWELSYKNTL